MPGSVVSPGSGEKHLQHVSVSAKSQSLIDVSRYCPERPYVELLVPEKIHTINTVVFRTSSHDQGWCDHSDVFGGTYQQSSTWFQAVVLSPIGHDRVPRRLVQYNITARVDFHTHENRWDRATADPGLQAWLDGIRGGDRIQIIPKADFLAWINFIQEAEIELHGLEGAEETASLPALEKLSIQNVESRTTSCYRPLNEAEREMRLIVLDPGSFDDPISCSLNYVSLDDASRMKYEALSYCWGDYNHMAEILLEYPAYGLKPGPEASAQRRFPVTRSLFLAMKYLRQPKRARTIWIDAICINQEDDHERSRQVGIMREIYHDAENVVVWLGEGDDVSKKCINLINTISERYEKDGQKANMEEHDLQAVHHPLLDENRADEFVDEWPLFEMSWFRRTWVVQEVHNAKTATVYCGKDTLPWPMVLRVNQCIRGMRLKANSGFRAVMPPLFAELAECTKRPTPTSILDIMINGLDFDASDPRDKIFAMLQFGKEVRDLKTLPPEIRPNYNKTTVQVFADFTRWWILHHRSLRILSALHAENGRTWQETLIRGKATEITDRPSWSLWYSGHSNYSKSILGLSEAGPYNASSGTQLDEDLILRSPNPLTLSLSGIQITTITTIAQYPYYYMLAALQSESKKSQMSAEVQAMHDVYVSLFDPINDTNVWTRDVFSQMKKYRTPQDTPLHDVDHYRAHMQYARKMGAIQCHSKSFFTTTEGKHGLVPPYARIGDVVVILFGARVPFVLRKIEGQPDGQRRFRFVGECYLPGYMEGNAMQEQSGERTSKTEVFELV